MGASRSYNWYRCCSSEDRRCFFLLRRQELSRQRGTAGLEQLLEVLVQVDNGNLLMRTFNSYILIYLWISYLSTTIDLSWPGGAHLHHLRPGSLYGHWCLVGVFPYPITAFPKNVNFKDVWDDIISRYLLYHRKMQIFSWQVGAPSWVFFVKSQYTFIVVNCLYFSLQKMKYSLTNLRVSKICIQYCYFVGSKNPCVKNLHK